MYKATAMAVSSMMMSAWLRAPGNRTPLLICKLVCSINVILKIQLNWTTIGRLENYFLRYKSKIKIGTHIINVAASGETPSISATKSLIALID